jgi:hypothetical protein
MLSAVMLTVLILSVVMLSVVILSVGEVKFVNAMLGVVMMSFVHAEYRN